MSLDTFLRLPQEKRTLIVQQGLSEFAARNYQDASTDTITQACGISKGSLFHYFGDKKHFYLYLLQHSLNAYQAAAETDLSADGGFYDLLWDSLEAKFNLYQTHPLETAFMIRAAHEDCQEVADSKNELMRTSLGRAQRGGFELLTQAVARLPLKAGLDPALVLQGLALYIDAIRTKFLEQYRTNPYAFYENRVQIRQEFKTYLDLFLGGVAKETIQ